MPEQQMIAFSFKELARLMIKDQNIHEGLWGIYVEFGLGAANIGSGPDDPGMLPAAIIPIKKIGLQKFNEENNLTVNAALENPETK
jgi:hypothetical protein